jgi:hypothetical protein
MMVICKILLSSRTLNRHVFVLAQFMNTWSLKKMSGIRVKEIRKAKNSGILLKASVDLDESTDRASEAFDYEFT